MPELDDELELDDDEDPAEPLELLEEDELDEFPVSPGCSSSPPQAAKVTARMEEKLNHFTLLSSEPEGARSIIDGKARACREINTLVMNPISPRKIMAAPRVIVFGGVIRVVPNSSF